MKQDKRFEYTKRLVERPMEVTRSVLEKSKKLRTPSEKADDIGTAVGGAVGVVIILGGAVQILLGIIPQGAGTLSIGAIALVSNRIHKHQKKNKKS